MRIFLATHYLKNDKQEMYYFLHVVSGRALVKDEEPVNWVFKLERDQGPWVPSSEQFPAFLETATLGKSKASVQPWKFL